MIHYRIALENPTWTSLEVEQHIKKSQRRSKLVMELLEEKGAFLTPRAESQRKKNMLKKVFVTPVVDGKRKNEEESGGSRRKHSKK